jgi:hypothetical protein
MVDIKNLVERYKTRMSLAELQLENRAKIYTADNIEDDMAELEAAIRHLMTEEIQFVSGLSSEERKALIAEAGGEKALRSQFNFSNQVRASIVKWFNPEVYFIKMTTLALSKLNH